MLLIYTTEIDPAEIPAGELERVAAAHRAIMDETRKRGILVAADPLQATASATTVRHHQGKVLTLDGPFAETKEQLAGYYILDCSDLDDAISWASRIPTDCAGAEGCVEVRPLRIVPTNDAVLEAAQLFRG